MADLYQTGWSPATIAPIALRDMKLGSRAPGAESAVYPSYTNAGAGVAPLPAPVAAAANNLNYGGLVQGVTPLQTRILNMLGTPDVGYLAAPTLTASAVQPGAMFSFSSNSAYQNPRFGAAYENVANQVASAQAMANDFARRQLTANRDISERYYNALNNYIPGGAGGMGDRLNTLYNLRSQVGQDTANLLNNRYMTTGSGWGGGSIPGMF